MAYNRSKSTVNNSSVASTCGIVQCVSEYAVSSKIRQILDPHLTSPTVMWGRDQKWDAKKALIVINDFQVLGTGCLFVLRF